MVRPSSACFLLLLSTFNKVFGKSGRFQYHHGAELWEQNGRTKTTRPGLRWLSDFELPVPKSAYNVKAVEQHTSEQNKLNELLGSLDWWGWELEDYSEQDLYVLQNGYCNGTLDGIACDDIFGDVNGTFASFGTAFMQRANESMDFKQELQDQIGDVEHLMKKEYYSIVGDYLGVGFRSTECRSYIEDTLRNMDEYDMAGWAASTTLYTVIPLLLTIGNLFVARSSEVYGTSFLVGTMSAMFSLGLPVKSLSAVRGKQRISVQSFAFGARQAIGVFGKPTQRDTAGSRSAAVHPVKLDELQKWSEEPAKGLSPALTPEQEATECSFGRIRRQVYKWQRRTHMWRIPALLVFAAQLCIFVFAIGPLFLGFGTPLLLFSCSNYLASLWLVIAAGISAVFRFIMWEKGAHERVQLYALSNRSLLSLRQLLASSKSYTASTAKGFLLNTTETELPPLHPPLLAAIGHSVYRGWRRLFPKQVTGTAPPKGILPLPSLHLRRHQTASQVVKSSITLLMTTISAAVHSPIDTLKRGFSTNPLRTGAMRTRPLVILMHLSTSGRNPLATLFTGFIEGLVLILLTVFFGASWGGNLLILCYVMGILLVTITLGRALGLWYVWRSARLFGLHVLETGTKRQIWGCLRVLCSMRDVLVEVNGSWWFEGYKLDEREGWEGWRLRYARGEFDEGCAVRMPVVRRKTSLSVGSMAPGAPQTANAGGSNNSISPLLPRASTAGSIRVSNAHVSSQAQVGGVGNARTTNARTPMSSFIVNP